VARTGAAWSEIGAVREVAALTLDMLAGARRWIYIEAQYLTARNIGKVLLHSLAAPRGPEIVVVLTRSSRGALEHFVMGSNRDRLLRRLRRADRHGRLRVYYPVVPGRAGPCEVLMHSKLIVADDRLLRIGSSNLNNRSMGLDTECDLAVEATDAVTSEAIAGVRNRLLAEHLDVDADDVARAVAAHGSLIRVIEQLNGRERGLAPHRDPHPHGPTRPLPVTWLFDPTKPFEPLWFLRRRRRHSAAPAPR